MAPEFNRRAFLLMAVSGQWLESEINKRILKWNRFALALNKLIEQLKDVQESLKMLEPGTVSLDLLTRIQKADAMMKDVRKKWKGFVEAI